MLQAYKSPSLLEEEGRLTPEVGYSAEGSPAELFAIAIGFIRRQFLVALLVVPLTIGLALVYLFTTPPLYSAAVTIIIDTGKLQVLPHSILGEDPVNTVMVDSQLEILKSENFALSIIKNLQLTQDPDFVGPDRGLIGIARKVISILEPNENEPKSELELTQRALRKFEDQLTVARVGMTHVIEIKFQSINPYRAAQIANAVADAFIADQLDSKYQTIKMATAWLQDRLNELRGQASTAERAVVDYKTKHNIVDTGGHLIDEQQLGELNTALVQARATKAEAQARLDRVTQILRDSSPDHAAGATIAEALQNPIITQLRQQYLEAAQREAMFSSRYGNSHLAVVNLRNRMQEIRRSILDELNRIAAAYKSDYDIAKARENSLEKNLAAAVAGSQTTNEAQIELRQLERAAQTYRALYDNFQQRYMDSVQQQSLPITEARVITRASPPSTKASPKSLLILSGATIGGLVLGFGLGILREVSDRMFRTGRQVQTQLKAECVAIVPVIKPSAKIAYLSDKAAANQAASRVISLKSGVLRYVIDSPLSPFAESIRAVKLTADLGNRGKFNKVIGITSSLPGEGKSSIAASLALLSADSGARVILVDCDLRKPSLSRQLAPKATPGLIDVATNGASLEKLLWSDPSTKLFFLPAGVKTRLIHTSEILASDAMKRVFVGLHENYDYVIVDLPPIAPVVDVRSTTHLVDSYLFVVEWGKTKIDVVEHSLSSARGIYDNLLGVVLNKVDFKKLNSYEGHGNYHHVHHYRHYGYTD